ncbi:MAG: PhoX family phosphatase [Alphaproteobacteria bacterium]|nr:PhoX family phosphatase [Alphaproteobacteria bacterium]
MNAESRARIERGFAVHRFDRFDRSQDKGINPSDNATLGEVVARRIGRRAAMKGALGASVIASALGPAALASRPARAQARDGAFNFVETEAGIDGTHHVAADHEVQILLRWGDPVLPGAPAFDPYKQSAASQATQFGYNCDYLAFMPLPLGSRASDRGLLCVNHEYASTELMFPNIPSRRGSLEESFKAITADIANVEMAAHGGSVVEVARGADGVWRAVAGSRFNRRITLDTPMILSGPAAGHDRLKTAADPTGTRVNGMVNNCAGGMTPWGTWLTGEENTHGYFWGKLPEGHAETKAQQRYGVPGRWYNWGAYHPRFDVGKTPNEPNRFGWVVEIDPYDPASTPKKRTALGRAKHEGAETIVNRDGRVVVYTGDDERFEYVYRFVSRDRYNPNDRAANRDLLDHGTLSVAAFAADGSMRWLPLVHGQGPLTAANGFASQADVLIEARRAADLLGATKMDRPEDVEPNPRTGKVYIMLTNNARRTAAQVDPANPRAANLWGQIVELSPPGGDHAADVFAWDMLIQAGDPAVAEVGARFHASTSRNGWFACPDNCAFDSQGRMWVVTDQGTEWAKASGRADGAYALTTAGPERGRSRLFFRAPAGAEVCGPMFTPDDTTLFLAIQHPGADGMRDWKAFGRTTSFEDPATRWPDFKPDMPPRPSVVAIVRKGGGRVG